MKRRNFLQAGSILPFFPYRAFGKELFGKNNIDSKNISGVSAGNDQRDFFYKPVSAWLVTLSIL